MVETLGLLFVIGLLAIVSPGPDLFLILRNAARYERSAALCTVWGITLGILVHIGYSIMGIAVVIAESVLIFTCIKICGAFYLMFIGVQSLMSQGTARTVEMAPEKIREAGGHRRAFKEGFLCNVTNPKVTLLMLSVFTQVISPNTPVWQQLVYGSVFVVQTIVYWSLLVICMQRPFVKQFVEAGKSVLDRIFGVLLFGLGIRVLIAD